MEGAALVGWCVAWGKVGLGTLRACLHTQFFGGLREGLNYLEPIGSSDPSRQGLLRGYRRI